MATVDRSEPELEELFALHARAFRERFGAGAAPRLFFSPGRVNLMGAHLDYNGGPVMPTAVDRGTFVAVRMRRDRELRIEATLEADGFRFDLAALPGRKLGRWVDYPLGVVLDLAERARAAGAGPPGLDLLFGGNLPIGAGLSSSASICVGTALVLDRLWGLDLEAMERVHAALRAERGFVGVQCGIMDPYAVGLARPESLLWLDCRDASWRHLPFDYARYSIGVVDSGVRRELAQGEFNQRVAECRSAFEALRPHVPDAECLRDVPAAVLEEHAGELDPVLARRAEHVVREVERTLAAREALLADDAPRMGRLMTEAHASLRDLYEVSCTELNAIVDAAGEIDGILGARLTGAGFGGCAVLLVERGAEAAARAGLQARFARRFGVACPVEFYAGDAGPREIVTR